MAFSSWPWIVMEPVKLMVIEEFVSYTISFSAGAFPVQETAPIQSSVLRESQDGISAP
jgi:hypothetical protein